MKKNDPLTRTCELRDAWRSFAVKHGFAASESAASRFTTVHSTSLVEAGVMRKTGRRWWVDRETFEYAALCVLRGLPVSVKGIWNQVEI